MDNNKMIPLQEAADYLGYTNRILVAAIAEQILTGMMRPGNQEICFDADEIKRFKLSGANLLDLLEAKGVIVRSANMAEKVLSLEKAAVYLDCNPIMLTRAVESKLLVRVTCECEGIYLDIDEVEQLKIDGVTKLYSKMIKMGAIVQAEPPEGSRVLQKSQLMPGKPYPLLYDKDINTVQVNDFMRLFNAAFDRIPQKAREVLLTHFDAECEVKLLSRHCGGFKISKQDYYFAFSSGGHTFCFHNEIIKVLSDAEYLSKGILFPSEPYPAELVISHELAHAYRNAMCLHETTGEAEEKAIYALLKRWYSPMAFQRYQQALIYFDKDLVDIIDRTAVSTSKK